MYRLIGLAYMMIWLASLLLLACMTPWPASKVNSSSNPCLPQSPPSGQNRVAVPLDVRDDSSVVDKEKRPYGKGTISDSYP